MGRGFLFAAFQILVVVVVVEQQQDTYLLDTRIVVIRSICLFPKQFVRSSFNLPLPTNMYWYSVLRTPSTSNSKTRQNQCELRQPSRTKGKTRDKQEKGRERTVLQTLLLHHRHFSYDLLSDSSLPSQQHNNREKNQHHRHGQCRSIISEKPFRFSSSCWIVCLFCFVASKRHTTKEDRLCRRKTNTIYQSFGGHHR